MSTSPTQYGRDPQTGWTTATTAPDNVAAALTLAQQARTLQGYTQPLDKPACENCWGCKKAGQRHECSLGGFAVNPRGWCPLWVATVEWITANPSASRQMGVSFGGVPPRVEVL